MWWTCAASSLLAQEVDTSVPGCTHSPASEGLVRTCLCSDSVGLWWDESSRSPPPPPPEHPPSIYSCLWQDESSSSSCCSGRWCHPVFIGCPDSEWASCVLQGHSDKDVMPSQDRCSVGSYLCAAFTYGFGCDGSAPPPGAAPSAALRSPSGPSDGVHLLNLSELHTV